MRIEWLDGIPVENFTVGREGNAITLIVDHWMATTFEGALARFRNPTQRVSAHYLISTDGEIVQVVKDEDTAYHAGNYDKNLISIGIEHEAGPITLPTGPLYAASAWLHAQISARYQIALGVGSTVLRHNAIVPTQCPGTLDLDRIVREAMAIEFVTTEDFEKYKIALEKELNDRESRTVVETLLQVKEDALKPRP